MEQERITEIRGAVAQDAAAIGRLVEQLGYTTTAQEIEQRLAPLMASPLDRVFVAEHDGVVVGLASIHVVPLLHDARPLARLTALVVDTASRGRGIGTQLTAVAEDFARASGCKRVELTSQSYRVAAHAFYEAHGYTPYEGQRLCKAL